MKIIPDGWRPFLESKTFSANPGELVRYSSPGGGNILLIGIDFILPTKKDWFISVVANGIYTVFFGQSEQLQNGKLNLFFGEFVYQLNDVHTIDILVTNKTRTKKEFSIIIRKLIPK